MTSEPPTNVSAALRAATLSFHNTGGSTHIKSKSPGVSSELPNDTRRNVGGISNAAMDVDGLLAAKRTWDRNSTLSFRSSSIRGSSEIRESMGRDTRWGEDDEILSPKGSIEDAKRGLFQENKGQVKTNLRNNRNSRRDTSISSAREELVDHSSIEDLHSLVNKFGGDGKGNNLESKVAGSQTASLVAARLATRGGSIHGIPSLAQHNQIDINGPMPRQSSSQTFSNSLSRKKDISLMASPEKGNAFLAATQVISSSQVTGRDRNDDAASLKKAKPQQTPPLPPPPRGSKVESKEAKGRRHRSVDEFFINDTSGKTLSSGSSSGYGGARSTQRESTSRYRSSENHSTVSISLIDQVPAGLRKNTVALQPAMSSARTGGSSGGSGNTFGGRNVSSEFSNGGGGPIPSFHKSREKFQSRPPISSSSSYSSSDRIYHADAILASSIASTKQPTLIPPKQIFTLDPPRKKQPPPPPPVRRRRSMPSIAIGGSSGAGRSVVGGGGLLRTTMREVKKQKEMDIRKENSTNNRRHNNMITEKQRKRYEGVWAANKGLLVRPSAFTSNSNSKPESHAEVSESDLVEGIIVRDIFSRSRLDFGTLAEIWDLVDRGNKGKLDRAEFVVGMWLVDGCLAGRKVPSRIGDEVWRCARRAGGLSAGGRSDSGL